LYEQVKGGKRTVCWLKSGGCDDISSVDPETLEFSARGISYGRPRHYVVHRGMNEKDAFIKLCERLHVQWLDEGNYPKQ
jgi:hypothetical protein